MKKYRACVADAYVLRDVLEYLVGRADDFASDVIRYRAQAEEAGEEHNEDSYYMESAVECQAKADAYERLLVRLSK